VALNAVRIVTGKNSIRHTMRDALLDAGLSPTSSTICLSLDAKALVTGVSAVVYLPSGGYRR